MIQNDLFVSNRSVDHKLGQTANSPLGALDGLTAEEINRRFQQIIAAEEAATLPTLDDDTFGRITAELANRPRLFTFVDLFCGAGGSSIGLTMAGGLLLLAANHSARAIETHAANFPGSEHECADINHYDMRKLPRGADILWASVICTESSPAGGRKRRTGRVGPDQLGLLELGPVRKDVFERTRACAQDVIRAAELHRFPIVIVENVVEFCTDWELFGWWLDGMALLGYHHQIVSASSAHIGGPGNPHAPQRRDRIYIVFNRKDIPAPDLNPRPIAHCATCGTVEGVQWWKKPGGTLTESGRHYRVGKYGIRSGQYLYRCPNAVCKNALVTPYERPAASVINWADLGTRIGDRAPKDALAATTLRRIQRGLEMFSAPFYVKNYSDSGRPQDRVRSVAEPFGAITTSRNHGLACPPFLDANGGSWNRDPSGVDVPFRTRTATEWEALVVPDGAFIDTARQNVNPTSAWAPFTTVAAGGNHHGLVVPYYRTGVASPTGQPFPTMTTRDSCGLAVDVAGELDIMACHYRMIQWYEQARAQRFPTSYRITGNNGERTAQAGNAVSSNVAQWIGERCADVLNRTVAS